MLLRVDAADARYKVLRGEATVQSNVCQEPQKVCRLFLMIYMTVAETLFTGTYHLKRMSNSRNG